MSSRACCFDDAPPVPRERRGATLAHEGVGVLSLREGRDADAELVPQQLVAGAERGAEAGVVRVVQQNHVRRGALQ